MLSQPKTLLLATIPEFFEGLQHLYSDDFQLKCVTRLDDAIAALDNHIDGILCNVHFDEGSLYDLLRLAKTHKIARSVPFFVIDASHTTTSPAITQSISIASKALGADHVIHMALWRTEMGDQEAWLKTLELVIKSLAGNDALQGRGET